MNSSMKALRLGNTIFKASTTLPINPLLSISSPTNYFPSTATTSTSYLNKATSFQSRSFIRSKIPYPNAAKPQSNIEKLGKPMRNVETVEYLTTNEPTKTTHFIVNHSEQFSDKFQPGNPHYEALSTTMENEKKPLLAGAPSGGKFAIFELGGTQHKVAVNDVIINDKIQPVEVFKVGAEIWLSDNILACGSQSESLIGLPLVSNAKVLIRVEEITRDATVIVFKKRRRKSSKTKNGHRRHVTMMRVLDIQYEC